jgi:hypothetical protein
MPVHTSPLSARVAHSRALREGRLTEPTMAVQHWRRKPLFVPQTRPPRRHPAGSGGELTFPGTMASSEVTPIATLFASTLDANEPSMVSSAVRGTADGHQARA